MAKHGDVWESPCKMMRLHCGPWQSELAYVTECDAVITDPPFSIRQSAGYRSGSEKWDRAISSKVKDRTGNNNRANGGGVPGSLIPYAPISQEYADEMAALLLPRTKHWLISFGDHISNGWIETALQGSGWVTFAPVPWVKRNPAPRFAGDGPANACEWIAVGRPRGKLGEGRTGSRPGYYLCNVENSQAVGKILVGQKPIGLMSEIVRHYTLPGDLILEPHCGSGSTLLACAIEGRRAIGAELDPKTYDLAVKRLSQGYTPRLQMESKPKPKQGELI